MLDSFLMGKHTPDIEKVGEILDQSLKRLELSGQLSDYGVWPIWNDTVGPIIARNAQPEKIRNGTLFVKVSSPIWMQQLHYMKDTIAEFLPDLIERLLAQLGDIGAVYEDLPALGEQEGV